MNTREEFGKYTLLRKLTEDALGETFRAGRSDGTGAIDQVVLLRVFNGHGLDGNALWQHTAQRAEIHKLLNSPNLAQGLDYGEQQNVPFAAYDYISGKDLGSLWEEANKQHNPIPTDQALLITERIALGLTSAYETRLRDQRILHGFVNPNMVMISNEGEIRLLGFESAPGLRELAASNAAPRTFARYLAPEALAGEVPHKSDDVYSLGVILYELLTGEALPAATAEGYGGVIDAARLAADEVPMPAELAGLLKRSLVGRGERIADAVSWHKELNRLMIEGQYNPTTFNLAFFMHSLFREDIERENREIQAEKSGELSGEKQQMMVPETGAVETMMINTADLPIPQQAPEPAPKRSMLPLVAVLLIVLVGGAAAAYYFLVLNKPPAQVEVPPPPPPAEPVGPSEEEQRLATELEALRAQMAEQMAQMAEMVDSQSRENQRELQQQQEERMRELQEQLDGATAAREREAQQRAEAEAAAEAAAQQLAQQEEPEATEPGVAAQEASTTEAAAGAAEAAATGTPAPATTQLAQVTPPPPPPERTTTTPPPPQPTTTTTTTTTRPRTPPPPPPEQTVRRGQLVTPGAGVVQPQILEKPDPRIPPVAKRARRKGVVHLQILVDENGKVVQVKQEGEELGLGLDEASIEAARRIRARPATKDGVPVKMWIGINYQFAL